MFLLAFSHVEYPSPKAVRPATVSEVDPPKRGKTTLGPHIASLDHLRLDQIHTIVPADRWQKQVVASPVDPGYYAQKGVIITDDEFDKLQDLERKRERAVKRAAEKRAAKEAAERQERKLTGKDRSSTGTKPKKPVSDRMAEILEGSHPLSHGYLTEWD